jgi:hypothetical protein
LRIQIEQHDAATSPRQSGGEIDRRRGFGGAALVIGDRNGAGVTDRVRPKLIHVSVAQVVV